jgi:hypothetical protein
LLDDGVERVEEVIAGMRPAQVAAKRPRSKG